MKFLIIRFSSIGDIVLTTPVVRCLKKQIPGAEVHYLTKSSFATVIEHNPYIDKLHRLSYSWELMIHLLRQEKFDYIIDLHNNLRSLRVKRSLGVKSFSFYKLNIEKWLYTNLKWNRLPDKHIVDRYMDTVKTLGVKHDGEGLDYFLNKHELVQPHDIPVSHQSGYIGLVIGAKHYTKKLPVNKWKQLCADLHHPLILLGGPEDRMTGDEIAAADPVKVYNACGKFSLNESADLVRNSKLIISHDTGLMHIAAAFKKPVISIWGNTVPAFGMYPYYGSAQVPAYRSEVNGLRCRPCSKIGYEKCPKGHFLCMEKQNLEKIFEAVKAVVSDQSLYRFT